MIRVIVIMIAIVIVTVIMEGGRGHIPHCGRYRNSNRNCYYGRKPDFELDHNHDYDSGRDHNRNCDRDRLRSRTWY